MSVWTGFVTDRVRECRDFYVLLFGCEVVFDEDWFVLLQHGGAQLGFLKPGVEGQAAAFRQPYAGAGAWVAVDSDDVDGDYARVRAAGVPIEVDLRTEPWGDRHFVIADPGGLMVDIVQHTQASGSVDADGLPSRPAPSTSARTSEPIVFQLRLVVEVDDFDEAVSFYRDAVGLPEQAAFTGDGDARVAIFEAGRATLELANRSQGEIVDGVEVGERCSPRFRVAFEVADTAAASDRLVSAGAVLLGAPRETPWRSLNSRLDAPGDIQLTLFQELETLHERSTHPGFGFA